jgi:hypothetical protein
MGGPIEEFPDITEYPDNTEPNFKGESEHPLAGIEDWMDSKRAAFVKNHPIISHLIQGTGDFAKGLYHSVDETGRNAAKALHEGNIPGAFQAVTSPLTGVVNQVNEKLLSGDISFQPDQARHEAISQVVGMAGLPGNEMQEAFHNRDYPRLVGQGVAALGLGLLTHGMGSNRSEINKSLEPTGPIDTSFTHGVENFKTDEIPHNVPPDLVPVGGEAIHNQQFDLPLRKTHEDLALQNHPELPAKLGAPQDAALHDKIFKTGAETGDNIEQLPEGWHRPAEAASNDKMVRLYRGETAEGIPGDKAGQNFTTDPLAATFYAKQNGGSGKTYYIDLPESEAAKYADPNATENGGHILSPELAEQARQNELGKGIEEGTSVIKPKEESPELVKQVEAARQENERLKGQVEPPTQQTINKPVQDGFAEPKFVEDAKLKDVGSPEVPPPGQITSANDKGGENTPFKDVSGTRAEYSSVHKLLSLKPETKPIADALLYAQDKGGEWLASNMRDFEEISRELDNSQKSQLGQLIDHGTKDLKYNLDPKNGVTPDLINRANQAKQLLDEVFVKARTAGATNESGKPIGYLDQYFTHMAKEPEGMINQIKEIYNHYLGRNAPIPELFLGKKEIPQDKGMGVTGDIYDKGMGNPWSPYTQTRSGMNPAEIEWNYNKVIPAYLESMKKVLFDAPAINKATAQLEKVPDSNLKDTATWAIKNFSGYDADKNLHGAFDAAANQVARVTARSFVNLNLSLHALHLGEIPVNIYPELGAKYTTMGVADMLRHPLQNYTEMVRLGLLQGETKPWAFKTVAERMDSASYFFSSIESMVKGIAYNGSKRMYLDQGMSPTEAKYAALAKAKDLTLTVDKARQMKGLSPEANVAGGPVFSRLGNQFKAIPSKIVEQYIDIAREVGKDPAKMEPYLKMMKAVAGSTAAGVATAYGAHMYHVNPKSLVATSAFGPFANTMYRIFANDIYNAGKRFHEGDDNGAKQYLMQAIIDTAAWATPGGNTLKKGASLLGMDTEPGKNSQRPMKLKFSNPVKVNLNQ